MENIVKLFIEIFLVEKCLCDELFHCFRFRCFDKHTSLFYIKYKYALKILIVIFKYRNVQTDFLLDRLFLLLKNTAKISPKYFNVILLFY